MPRSPSQAVADPLVPTQAPPAVLPAPLTLLTSGMASGTSVRFWCRQATCRPGLSQMHVCGQRWAAVCQAGPSGSSRRSSSTKETLRGLGEGGMVCCSQGQGSHAVHSPSPAPVSGAPEMSSFFGPREGVIALSLTTLHAAKLLLLALTLGETEAQKGDLASLLDRLPLGSGRAC